MSDNLPSFGALDAAMATHSDTLIALRRDLHAHPELSWHEERTTDTVAQLLDAHGLRVKRLPTSGLVAEIGPSSGPVVALRADLDALPVQDATPDEWASTVEGVTHACGHDVHTTALTGAALALADIDTSRRVRFIFQPAEEVMPGGAQFAIEHGVLEEVTNVFALHCDPGLDVGVIGLREGPLTGAADSIAVTLSGKGGHTSRPHLTQDLTFALAKLITELPAVLSRRLDPRAGVSLVWGKVQSGSAHNIIPSTGLASGTIRMLDAVAWADAEPLIRQAIDQILAPYGVTWEVRYVRGVPPVVNEHKATALLGRIADDMVGEDNRVPIAQSLGGEDFAWYLEGVPGAMARLGTRTPGGPTYDLHQGDLRVDEGAIAIGARFLARAAISVAAG